MYVSTGLHYTLGIWCVISLTCGSSLFCVYCFLHVMCPKRYFLFQKSWMCHHSNSILFSLETDCNNHPPDIENYTVPMSLVWTKWNCLPLLSTLLRWNKKLLLSRVIERAMKRFFLVDAFTLWISDQEFALVFYFRFHAANFMLSFSCSLSVVCFFCHFFLNRIILTPCSPSCLSVGICLINESSWLASPNSPVLPLMNIHSSAVLFMLLMCSLHG